MAHERDWNAHKVSHALMHNPQRLPIKLSP